jgi:hypothetical protein
VFFSFLVAGCIVDATLASPRMEVAGVKLSEVACDFFWGDRARSFCGRGEPKSEGRGALRAREARPLSELAASEAIRCACLSKGPDFQPKSGVSNILICAPLETSPVLGRRLPPTYSDLSWRGLPQSLENRYHRTQAFGGRHAEDSNYFIASSLFRARKRFRAK